MGNQFAGSDHNWKEIEIRRHARSYWDLQLAISTGKTFLAGPQDHSEIRGNVHYGKEIEIRRALGGIDHIEIAHEFEPADPTWCSGFAGGKSVLRLTSN